MTDMHKVITMNREYGCCGSEIASETAKRLGIDYYDRNLVNQAIEYGGIEPGVLESVDEKSPNLAFYKRVSIGNEKAPKATTVSDVLYSLQKDVLVNAAKEKDYIVVGRCGNFALKDEPIKLLRVKLIGSMDFKIDYVMKTEGLSEFAAIRAIKKKEQKRKDSYYYHTKQSWADPLNYDICLNVDKLGIEGCVNALCGLYNTL